MRALRPSATSIDNPACVPNPSASSQFGERLASQTAALRLLFLHLAGRAVLRRVELDDLVQEVFLRALADRAGIPPPEPREASLRRYLAHLARHVTVDVARSLRASKRDGRVQRLDRSAWSRAGVGESHVALPGPGPATAAAGAEDAQQLLSAFRNLSPDHRRVIGLRQFEGLDARAAAGRMGRGEAAIHSLYRRALLAWEQGAQRGFAAQRDESSPPSRPDPA